jgi:putative FmdB family regulatory protein
MPVYEYSCKCGHEIEKLHKITVKPVILCIKCGKRMEKCISGGISVRYSTPPASASAGKETQ